MTNRSSKSTTPSKAVQPCTAKAEKAHSNGAAGPTRNIISIRSPAAINKSPTDGFRVPATGQTSTPLSDAKQSSSANGSAANDSLTFTPPAVPIREPRRKSTFSRQPSSANPNPSSANPNPSATVNESLDQSGSDWHQFARPLPVPAIDSNRRITRRLSMCLERTATGPVAVPSRLSTSAVQVSQPAIKRSDEKKIIPLSHKVRCLLIRLRGENTQLRCSWIKIAKQMAAANYYPDKNSMARAWSYMLRIYNTNLAVMLKDGIQPSWRYFKAMDVYRDKFMNANMLDVSTSADSEEPTTGRVGKRARQSDDEPDEQKPSVVEQENEEPERPTPSVKRRRSAWLSKAAKNTLNDVDVGVNTELNVSANPNRLPLHELYHVTGEPPRLQAQDEEPTFISAMKEIFGEKKRLTEQWRQSLLARQSEAQALNKEKLSLIKTMMDQQMILYNDFHKLTMGPTSKLNKR